MPRSASKFTGEKTSHWSSSSVKMKQSSMPTRNNVKMLTNTPNSSTITTISSHRSMTGRIVLRQEKPAIASGGHKSAKRRRKCKSRARKLPSCSLWLRSRISSTKIRWIAIRRKSWTTWPHRLPVRKNSWKTCCIDRASSTWQVSKGRDPMTYTRIPWIMV